MPTRRERMRTSFSVMRGLCTWVTTGFLGSSNISAFIALSRMRVFAQVTASILRLKADAKTASSNAMLSIN
jgi:hypothetical protein